MWKGPSRIWKIPCINVGINAHTQPTGRKVSFQHVQNGLLQLQRHPYYKKMKAIRDRYWLDESDGKWQLNMMYHTPIKQLRGVIYAILYLPKGKVYVGQTINSDLSQRHLPSKEVRIKKVTISRQRVV